MSARLNTFWRDKICCCFYRKQLEEPGYITLTFASGDMHDPDSVEEYFDWWTKYFESVPWKKSSGMGADPYETPGKATKNILTEQLIKNHTAGIEFFSNELEKQPEYEGFSDILAAFRLAKTSKKRKNDAGIFKGSVALYQLTSKEKPLDKHSYEHGIFMNLVSEIGAVIPLVIRVYVVRAHQLSKAFQITTINPFIEVCLTHYNQTLSDSGKYIKNESYPIFGRCYELRGRLPFDSTLTVKVKGKTGLRTNELIGQTEIDIENRYYSRHRGSCGLQRVYSKEGYNAWRDAEKPSQILNWMCLNHNLPLPHYQLDHVSVAQKRFYLSYPHLIDDMRSQELIKENLALSVLLNWKKVTGNEFKLVEEHVETRSLYSPFHPGIEKGKLEMWVDLFPANTELPPPVNIAPRVPEKYELRAVVWSCRNVLLVERGTVVGKRNTDIFVKGKPGRRKHLPYSFSVKRFDAWVTLQQLEGLMWLSPAHTLNIPFGKPLEDCLTPSNLDEVCQTSGCMTGMVDLELSLLTALEAERSPAGRGRKEPDALPPPIRPVVQYTIWIVPFRAIKNYLWTYHRGSIVRFLLLVLFSVFLMVTFYALPNYSVKRFLGA